MKRMLIAVPAVVLAVLLARLLAARSNTQVHRINQDKPALDR
ncbi:hypothetical protein AB0L65_23005 [Nonomuraea sp. NPDC052116]